MLSLAQNIRPQAVAHRRVEPADRENVRVCRALCDVPGCAITAGLATGIVLTMILHDGAKCCHHPGSPVQFARRNLLAETGNIPTPKRDARGTGGESSHNGMAKGLPGRILITRPVGRAALASCIARAAKRQSILAATLAEQLVIRLSVEYRESVYHLVSTATIGKEGVAPPQVLAAIGLETIHPHLLDQVTAAGKPPR